MTTTTRTRPAFVPDPLDQKLFAAFPGLVMRKDLTQDMLPRLAIELRLRVR